jgi:formylglycine-generating enzyme required for sulfatase activity
LGEHFDEVLVWYGDYPSGSVTDPTGAALGSARVLRGGGWDDISEDCYSAIRVRLTPDDREDREGFRVLRSSIK